MDDLQKVKQVFNERELSLVAVNADLVWSTSGRGIKPLFDFITQHPQMAQHASVADKVIGKAAALLAVYGGINAIFAELSTYQAQKICQENQIFFEAKQLVEAIENRDKTDLCPMEKLSEGVTVPKEMVEKVYHFLNNRPQ